jgi:response regulator NasT
MKKAFIISKTETSIKTIATMLADESYDDISASTSVEDARARIAGADYDLIVINTPLSEESGVEFSVYCAGETKACVILMVQQEKSIEVFNMVDKHGVLVISKPVNKHLFHHYLIFTQCFKERMLSIHSENEKLKNELEEMKIIDRAKLLLIQCLSMTEQQAHRYITRQAMNMRTSKLNIAKQVIRTYEN